MSDSRKSCDEQKGKKIIPMEMRRRALRPSELPLLISNEFEDFPAALASRGKDTLLAHTMVGGKGTRNHPMNRKITGSPGPMDGEGSDGDVHLGS